MKALTYYKALNVQDAFLKLQESEKNIVLGGGLWLKRSNFNYNTLIDITNCGLNEIHETEDEFVIGSMVSLRDLEVSNLSQNYFDGVLGDAINQVMGVPLRNSATIGGTIMGKFPFSDIITPLMVLDVTLDMYPERHVTLKDFLAEKVRTREILTAIHVKKQAGKAKFKKVKLTDLGFAIVNLAVSNINNQYKIAVGARPGVAALAVKTMDLVNNNELSDEIIQQAGDSCVNELMFLDTSTNSKDYRQHLVRVYVRRLLKEVK